MAYQEVSRMEIQEIIRRWQAGDSQRKIALGTGLSRDTIIVPRQLYLPVPVASLRNVTETLAPGVHSNQR